MDEEDAEWLRSKADFAPDEETEARYKAIAERIDGQQQTLMARWDRIQELESKLEGESNRANTFENHLAEIREALGVGSADAPVGVSESDDLAHAVNRLVSRLDAVRLKCETGAGVHGVEKYPYGDGYRQACADVLAMLVERRESKSETSSASAESIRGMIENPGRGQR